MTGISHFPRGWIAALAAAFVGCGFAPAQIGPEADFRMLEDTVAPIGLPDAGPDAGIIDPQGFFKRDTKTRDRVQEVMRALQAKHGFRLLLVIEPFYLESDVHRAASEHQERWLPKGDGMVVVFESDSRRIGMSRGISEANESPDGIPPMVPPHVLNLMCKRVLDGIDPGLPSPKLLEALIFGLAVEFDEWFDRRAERKSGSRHLRAMLLLLGFGCIVGLLMMVARVILNRPGTRDDPVRLFPVVDVPERLGAPYGGGQISCRKFRE